MVKLTMKAKKSIQSKAVTLASVEKVTRISHLPRTNIANQSVAT